MKQRRIFVMRNGYQEGIQESIQKIIDSGDCPRGADLVGSKIEGTSLLLKMEHHTFDPVRECQGIPRTQI